MNPYRHDLLLAGMLAAPERFIGLRDELEWILATISAERPAAVSLVGPWGFGKTLMLGYLAHPDGARRAFGGSIGTRFRAAPEYLLFVTLPLEYVEFDERGRFNLFEQLYTQAMRTLATLLDIADLHLIRFDDIPPPLPMNLAALRSMIGRARDRLFDEEGSRPPAAPEPSSPVSWHYRLIELLNHLTGWGFRPIFILDSFDTIIGHLNLDDFEQLRALLPHASLITATRRALSEIVHTDIQSSPFFNLIQRLMLMPITFLPADEARRMIHEPPGWFAESAGFSWSDSDTAFILELTGQHLDLIRGACEQLYMWANPRRSTAHTDQLPLAQRPLLRAQLGMTFAHAFAALWHLLTPAERTILQDVATGMPLTGVAPHHISSLIARGFLMPEQQSFRLFAGLFHDFVLAQAAATRSAERAGTPAGAALPLPADLVLTELEQQLLAILQQNAGRPVLHETIIAALYDDRTTKKAADGTTPSPHVYRNRLDALMFRLRGKLEGQPVLIENLRGIGYRLVITQSNTQ